MGNSVWILGEILKNISSNFLNKFINVLSYQALNTGIMTNLSSVILGVCKVFCTTPVNP